MVLTTKIGKRGEKKGSKTVLSVNVPDDILAKMSAEEKEAAVLAYVARQARVTAVNRFRTQDGSISTNRELFKKAVNSAIRKGVPAEAAEEFAMDMLTSLDEAFTLNPTTEFSVGLDSVVSPLWRKVEGSEDKVLVNPFAEDAEDTEDTEDGE